VFVYRDKNYFLKQILDSFVIAFFKIDFGSVIWFCEKKINKEIFKESFKWKICL